MPSPETLMVGLVAGIFGMAYFVYGKHARRPAFLLAGIGLCVYPYLVSGVLLEILIGAILAAVPFVVSSE